MRRITRRVWASMATMATCERSHTRAVGGREEGPRKEGDMGRYGEIWGAMGSYGEIWGDMGRWRTWPHTWEATGGATPIHRTCAQ